MKTHLAFTVAALSSLAAAPLVHADTLACGNRLIETGDTATRVRATCGEPSSREVVTEPVHVRTRAGGTRVIGTTQKEIWVYDRGSRKFAAILTFEDGVLKKLEFGND